jgi:CheY-like chemotaxis protein
MKKVLLIEDDQVLQDMYRDKFTHDGYEIQVAENGKDGIALMTSFKPTVVLLDLLLPDTTGFNILDVVKDDPQLKNIPIVVLTNIYADREDLVKNKGAKAVLLKANTTPDEVVEAVKRLLQ